MLGFFALQVPAGLTIYWVTTNLFTLTQSLAVRAYFAANPPKINLPDYWDSLSSDKDMEDMTPEERRQAVQAGLSVGPTMEDLKIGKLCFVFFFLVIETNFVSIYLLYFLVIVFWYVFLTFFTLILFFFQNRNSIPILTGNHFAVPVPLGSD